MPSEFVSRLSPVLLALSIGLMLAMVWSQESPTSKPQDLTHFSQNMRLLSAEQINSRTLTLAAEIGDFSK